MASSRRIAPPRWLKPMNKTLMFLQRFGVMKELPVLIVPGRKSGKPRRTPLTVVEHKGRRYLLEGFPGADWARNVRAADGLAQMSLGGRGDSCPSHRTACRGSGSGPQGMAVPGGQ
ncbi:deazaflavin-dependent oxidoreductase, nitroreductase family [Gordonia paraffinivorans]|uniref:Deazaflavin-dependent oxidoreductase, nitroreductase family n=1 Tax=Gordonia paraffinivorans TaxID=175628 RepID=A0ABD7UYS3_9ACTN|nr:deazaflavin-dependent oxidoreductase, nitroreductase family [Gordonia paraffinivorans]